MTLMEANVHFLSIANVPFKQLFEADTMAGIVRDKGRAGKLLERALGLANTNVNRDFEDGELKTNKCDANGKPRETVAITQISSHIDDLIAAVPFEESWLYEKISNMLYIPALALVAITVSVLLYVLHRNSRLDKTIRTPLIIVAVAGVLALSFVTDVNSYYCSAVDTHIREQLAQECTEITLPCAPYATQIVPIIEAQLSEYYDFPSHGEVKITYVPFEKWDWITYYDAHNVPVIQEYDEDAVETEDWAFEFEED